MDSEAGRAGPLQTRRKGCSRFLLAETLWLMHDPANTLSGRYGFLACYPGGIQRSEDVYLWDELLLEEPILALKLVNLKTGEVHLELEGFIKFFFANEAVSGQHFQQAIVTPYERTKLTAKIFGGIRANGLCEEVRIEFEPTLIGRQRVYPAEKLPYVVASLRPGIPPA